MPQHRPDYPQWVRTIVLLSLVGVLVGVIIADARSTAYDAGTTALALVGVIGTAIGFDQLRKGGKDDE